MSQNPCSLRIRRFQPSDEAALFRVYFSAIRQIAARDYSPEQIRAWAPEQMEPASWAGQMQALQPFVARIGPEIVGYASLGDDGYVDHFYVSGLHPRQGIGTRLMRRIHQEAMRLRLPELTSDVSKTAEPFFAHHGFQVIERKFPVCRGVVLQNARMRKTLMALGAGA